MTRTFPSIPPDQRLLQVTIQEPAPRWLDPSPIRRIVDALATSPWGSPAEMSADLGETWKRFDAARAVETVWRGGKYDTAGQTGVSVRWAPGATASIAQSEVANTIALTLARKELAPVGLPQVEALIARLAAALMAMTSARAVPDPGIEYPALRGMLQPPPPFMYRAWLQVLAPRAYEPVIDRAELLAAPARIEERGDAIWLWTFEDPFAYDDEAAVDQIRALSAYLRERVRAPGPR
jgi:hypothetical protein